ncbi:MAG: Stf0 family sulfotransferase [Pseudomonadota bacterium]
MTVISLIRTRSTASRMNAYWNTHRFRCAIRLSSLGLLGLSKRPPDQGKIKWFAREGVVLLQITYDELANDTRGTLARVLGALGLDPKLVASVEVPTAKLADTVSREWLERFIAERVEGGNVS